MLAYTSLQESRLLDNPDQYRFSNQKESMSTYPKTRLRSNKMPNLDLGAIFLGL